MKCTEVSVYVVTVVGLYSNLTLAYVSRTLETCATLVQDEATNPCGALGHG